MEVLSKERRFAAAVAPLFAALTLQLAGDLGDGLQMLEDVQVEAGRGTEPFTVQRMLWAGSALSYAHLHAGDLAGCARAAGNELELAIRYGLGDQAANARAFLGTVAYERNELEDAIAYYSAAVKRVDAGIIIVINSTLGFALTLEAAGRSTEADATIALLLDRLLATGSAAFVATVRSFEARLALSRGDLAPALRWLQTTPVDIDAETLHATELPALTRTKILLAEGSATSLATAENELELILRRAVTTHAVRRQIEVLALLALTKEAQRRHEEALATLRASLDLAAPRGFVRTFVDLSPPIARLLRSLIARDGGAPVAERLLVAFDHPPSTLDPTVPQWTPPADLPQFQSIDTVLDPLPAISTASSASTAAARPFDVRPRSDCCQMDDVDRSRRIVDGTTTYTILVPDGRCDLCL
jgi:tetratricopeptide (TPR) repeat protein